MYIHIWRSGSLSFLMGWDGLFEHGQTVIALAGGGAWSPPRFFLTWLSLEELCLPRNEQNENVKNASRPFLTFPFVFVDGSTPPPAAPDMHWAGGFWGLRIGGP